jgi:CRISPR/Cas system-associated protein endoribonuclease Cas2
LECDIGSFGTNNIIIGGDFNCTFSTDNIRTNIDCLNMNAPPNLTHSMLIADMCEHLQITDPYQIVHPNKKEYSYVPMAVNAINRSRIDFFLVSTHFITKTTTVSIADNLQNKLFDHRACFFTAKKLVPVTTKNKPVDNTVLSHDVIELINFASSSEAYALHVNNADLPVPDQRAVLRRIGDLKSLIKDIGPPIIPPDELMRDEGRDFLDTRSELFRRAKLCKDDINRYDLPNLRMVPEPDVFFKTLLGMMKNDIISYQVYARLVKNKSFNDLKNRIVRCKADDNGDFETLFVLERALDKMSDTIMRGEVSKHSMFDILNNEKMTPHFVNMTKLGKILRPWS